MIGYFSDIKILFHGGDTGKTNLKNRFNVVFLVGGRNSASGWECREEEIYGGEQ